VGWSGELLGEASCLGAACLWAVAVALFRPTIEAYGARAINLIKCSLATVLLGITTWLTGQGGTLGAAPAGQLWLIAASGVVGLTLGDTALFASVARIGTHRTLLLQTLAPIFTALIAGLWQREIPTPGQTAGAAVILLGVGVVVAPRRGAAPASNGAVGSPARGRAATRYLAVGVGFGVLAALGQGAGVVLAKEGMQQVPFLPAAFLRLFAAAAGLVVLSATSPSIRSAIQAVRSPLVLRRAVPATIIGTYVAMILMMAGIQLAPAAVAAVLLSTSPVFGLFVDRWTVKEPITARGLLGTLIAVAGVAILTK
jgi:drug/metabolite transporter (DMT)-like permease